MPLSTHRVESNVPMHTQFCFTFEPNGASAPTVNGGAGSPGVTVARSAAGDFLITFDRKFPAIRGYSAHLAVTDPDVTAGTPGYAQCGAYTAASRTLKVFTLDNTFNTADFTNSSDGSVVTVRVDFRNSTIPG